MNDNVIEDMVRRVLSWKIGSKHIISHHPTRAQIQRKWVAITCVADVGHFRHTRNTVGTQHCAKLSEYPTHHLTYQPPAYRPLEAQPADILRNSART